MREDFFIESMANDASITSKDKAVASRLAKARKVESFVGVSFDTITGDDELMYKTLIKIRDEMGDSHGNLANSLRKYFYYVKGTDFPSMRNVDTIK